MGLIYHYHYYYYYLPTKGDGRLCFRQRRYVGRYIGIYVLFVNNFLAPIQVQLSPNLSVIPLATGDEVIKFWKVKVDEPERPSSYISNERYP